MLDQSCFNDSPIPPLINDVHMLQKTHLEKRDTKWKQIAKKIVRFIDIPIFV